MKLQLTQKGKDFVQATKTLKNLGFENSFEDLCALGLEEIIDELRAVSFENEDQIIEYDLNTDILLDSPIKSSYLIKMGLRDGFIHIV